MPFNFRLNLQSVFRRLGIQSGARLPQLNDNVQMVMLITDLSRLIPAPIEPRGMCGSSLATAGQFSVCQLRALSPGGIFVESMFVRAPAPALTDNYFLDVTTLDLGLALATNINIGGTQIRSIFTAGPVAVLPGGVSIPSPDGFSGVNIDLGVFVPNQAFLTVGLDRVTLRLDIMLTYRELPSVEEVG